MFRRVACLTHHWWGCISLFWGRPRYHAMIYHAFHETMFLSHGNTTVWISFCIQGIWFAYREVHVDSLWRRALLLDGPRVRKGDAFTAKWRKWSFSFLKPRWPSSCSVSGIGKEKQSTKNLIFQIYGPFCYIGWHGGCCGLKGLQNQWDLHRNIWNILVLLLLGSDKYSSNCLVPTHRKRYLWVRSHFYVQESSENSPEVFGFRSFRAISLVISMNAVWSKVSVRFVQIESLQLKQISDILLSWQFPPHAWLKFPRIVSLLTGGAVG